MRYDAIIIGAGLSGLAAGIRLAMFDKRVLLLEAHGRPGGLNSFYERGERHIDVGLHAVTNFVPRRERQQPLNLILRQLRIPYDDLAFEPQWGSEIRFPSATLRFDNDPATLRESVAAAFPSEIDGFDRLAEAATATDETDPAAPQTSTRARMAEFLREPLLVDMLLCPLMFYGSPTEDDMPWPRLALLWKSLYASGFARPRDGMRPLVERLVDLFREHGGELRYGARVEAILEKNNAATGVRLASGEEVAGELVFSSAGRVETAGLCASRKASEADADRSRVSIVESLFCLDAMPREFGCDATIVFYSRQDAFPFRCPDGLVDYGAGVICIPNHYGAGDALDEGQVRVSHLANYRAWRDTLGAARRALADDAGRKRYAEAKEETLQRCREDAERVLPGMSGHVVFADLFTPLTLERYTAHAEGCLYGATQKSLDGSTPVQNLFLIGADQGYHGIVGALLSGITVANRQGLKT